MTVENKSEVAVALLALRTAVAFLGERPQLGWWDSSFLNSVGLQYLALIYPRTAAQAALTSSFNAACLSHDERIGLGRVAHLFRLSRDLETALDALKAKRTSEELQASLSIEGAFSVLDRLGKGARATDAPGPVQIGDLSKPPTLATIGKFAATFATGFRNSRPVFPYLN